MISRPHRLALGWMAAWLGGLMPTLAAQTPAERATAVTPALVQEGAQLFRGVGLCASCHGPEGAGIAGLTPDLRDTLWLHSSGSFPDLVTQVLEGVPSDRSSTGISMPPRGGGRLSDHQVRAVAAYVWSLSHRNPPPDPVATPSPDP